MTDDEKQHIRQLLTEIMVEKTPYRIRAKNLFGNDDSGETLMIYVPEYYNAFTGLWTKIHKRIRNKKPEYFFDLDEARSACYAHARKQGEIVWSELL